MENLIKKLEPSVIYLTEGSLQKISWLCKNWEIVHLWSPTIQEVTTTLEEYTEDYKAVIITPRSLKTVKQDKVYGLPIDEYLYINPLTYVFVSLDESPQILDEESKDKQKKLKSELETNVNGLNYKRLTLNNKSFDVTKDPLVKNLISELDDSISKKIIEAYSDYPYQLIKTLKSPNLFDLEDINEDTVTTLVNRLGTLEGVKTWSELSNQEIMGNFVIKTLTDSIDKLVNTSFIVKSVCSLGRTSDYDSILGVKKLTTPFNQELYFYLKPILKKIENVNVEKAKLYLGLFARFALAVTVKSSGWDCGFQLQKSKKGSTYLVNRLSKTHQRLWNKNILKVR